MNKLVGLTADAGTLVLMVMAVPFVILLVGMPFALLVRLALEIVRWLR